MGSPSYYYYHHYDPTLINGHSLLQPHAYQQSTYFNTSPSLSSQYISPPYIPNINTHIPPAPTYPKLTANNSPHYLPHHMNSVIQELHRSQQACIQAISNLASDISTLNKSLTPPNLTYNHSTTSFTPFFYQQPLTPSNISPPNFTYQQPNITSTTVINHNFPHSHDPSPSPEPTPFIHHSNLPPFNTPVPPFTNVEGQVNIPYDQNPNTFSVMNDSSVVETGEEFNESLALRENRVTTQPNKEGIESSPCMNPNVATEIIGDIVFSISKIDKKHTAKKFASDLLSLSYSEIAKLISTMTVSEDLWSLEKTVSCAVVVEAPLPQRLFIFDPGVGERQVRSLAMISSNLYRIISLLVPWDRGKMVFSSFLFSVANLAPVMVSFPARGAASVWPWVSWSSMKMTASVTTTSAKHVREEDTPKVNWELKSLKFFNDLMDSSYLAQNAFSYLARDAKKNWSFEQEFGNKSTQHTLNFIWFLNKL